MLIAQTPNNSNSFTRYRDDAQAQREWPGLSSLLGARILHSIQVHRQDG
jgi:hypothetical protein